MRRLGALLAGLGMILAVSPTLADTPTTMNFQGRLTDTSPSQLPIDMTLPMEFRIYDTLTFGNLLWNETWTGVTVSDGLFSVILGSNGTPLTEAVFAGPDRFVEIVVNSEVLSPRQTLSAVGFAQQAKNSDSLGGSPASAWQMSIASGCTAGFFIRQINPDGTIVCAVDADSGGDITDVTAGPGLTGGGSSGATTLAADFDGTGNADSVARSDHAHDGGPVPPASATRATLTGLATPIDGWISGDDPLSTQFITPRATAAGVFTINAPEPGGLGPPESDPLSGILTFTTSFAATAPLLEWLENAIQGGVGGSMPEVVIILEDEVGLQVRRIELVDAWPLTWSLDYLPSGVPVVNIKIAAFSMVVP